jgi:hypothetical protein
VISENMAQWEAYSWLGLAAASPVAFAVICWSVAVSQTYRKHWRSIDLLLAALLVTHGLGVILIGSWGVLKLARPNTGVPCSLMVGAITAVRTMQLTTAASLVVDRALTIKWPYRYRLAARRTHILYHLVVLTILSILVGVAAILALPAQVSSTFATCTILPYDVDVKYSSFTLFVEGGLLSLIFIGLLYVQVSAPEIFNNTHTYK